MARENVDLKLSVSDDQLKRLRAALGARKDLEELISKIAQAGADEILAQAAGEAVFSSMSDLRSFRIYCLLRREIPIRDAESIVAEIFQIPPPTAKRLVNTALSRYSVDLEDSLRGLIATALNDACWETADEHWRVSLASTYVRQRVLEMADASQEPKPKTGGRGQVWFFDDETYQAVRKRTGLDAKAKTACPK